MSYVTFMKYLCHVHPGTFTVHTLYNYIYMFGRSKLLTVQFLYDQQKLFKKSPDAKIPLLRHFQNVARIYVKRT